MDYLTRILAVIERDQPCDELLYHRPGQIGDMNLDGDRESKRVSVPARQLTLAAVLVPIVTHEDEPTILLTRRADHLQNHSGQVAFPGGKVEASDASPSAAALREAHEEVGLDPSHVTIHGYLNTYETGTGFRILPVVGFVRPGFSPTPDENEVAEIFEIPLRVAMAYGRYQFHKVKWQGQWRSYYSMQFEGYNIWGATAGMLRHMGKCVHDGGAA